MSELWSRLPPTMQTPWVRQGLTVLLVLILCVVAYAVARRVILRAVAYVVERTPTAWDDALLRRGVFDRGAWIAPALVLYYSVYAFDPETQDILQRFLLVYMTVVVILVITQALGAINDVYQSGDSDRRVPIKGYVQIAQLVVTVVGIILLFGAILDRSPWGILSGLGAATALVLLVFRDTILSFVASVQLTTYDMVRVGDWISVPQYGADGDVIDVALHTVKVQNWDKTISTIPTHKLMEESFRNWRGMVDSGGRRIARALMIDMTSVRFLEPDDVERLSKVALLRRYLADKQAELDTWNREQGIVPDSPINGRRLTNIGTFRAYLVAFLRANPLIHQDMTFLVRQLEPQPDGLPIQIYVFSRDQRWAHYEALQADIFDHVLAALPAFGLRVFQRPTGYDLRGLGNPVADPN
jgi:miniconductance mechanosensitive channel